MSSKSLRRQIYTLMLICALIWSSAGGLPAGAQQNLNYTGDDWLSSRYDWVLYLNPKTLPDYLKYPTSSLNPVVNVAVNYRISPRLPHGDASKQTHYEDLWYHGARPIGCHRFTQLPLSRGWQGAIVIPASSDAATNAGALANTIVRLLLEVSLAKCQLVVILAPPGQESVLCDQLGQFKFYRTEDMSIDNSGAAIHLFVSSGDIRDRTFLVYEPKK